MFRSRLTYLYVPLADLGLAWLVPFVLSVTAIAAFNYNFLLFHTLAELFAIIIAFILFATALQTYQFTEDHFLTYLGVGYACVAGIDIIHTLVYKGLNIIPDVAPDASIRFWLSGRYIEAFMLVTAIVFIRHLPHHRTSFVLFGGLFVAAVLLGFSDVYPQTFVEGMGLTPFKVWSEYILIAVYLGAAAYVFVRPLPLGQMTTAYLFASLIFTAMAEYAFTLYIDVYGLTNMLGHAFKIFSYWMIYQAMVRQRLEEPFLEKFRTEAESQAKNEFLASMSHDLRTPLNAIIGFSQVMEQRTFGPLGDHKYEEYIGDIQRSARHLIELINDILDISKIESGRFEIGDDPIDIPEAILTSVMMSTPSANAKGISIAVEEGDMTFARQVLSSEKALIELFNNLMSNAIRYSDPDTTITVSYTSSSSGLKVRIKDMGVGMTVEQIANAMKPFERINSAHSLEHKGTGLGLYICSKLMEMHGGRLTLFSRPGEGTTAELLFPPERLVAEGSAHHASKLSIA